MPSKIALIFFALTGFAAIIESVGDALFAKWSLAGKGYFLAMGLALYFIGSCLWAYSLKYETLSKGVVLFNVVNILIGVLVGTLYFKEVLTGLNLFGIALGIASVVLLSL